MKRLFNKKVIGILLALSLITTIIVPNLVPDAVELVGDSFTIGTVEGAGVADATCDGADDDVQAQVLLTALPATGGRISILTGTYVWANATTVTRAIDGVTIVGTGIGTSITGDAVTAPFTAGGNNWVLQDFETDVTAAVLLTAMGATTDWEWRNVTTSDVYFAYRTVDATTAVSWDIPAGRTATYTVAASDATAHVIAQADYVCDGTADEVEIQAAITAIGVVGGGVLHLTAGNFTVTPSITLISDLVVEGEGDATVLNVQNGVDAGTGTGANWALFIAPTTLDNISIYNCKIDLGGNATAGLWAIGFTTGSTNVVIDRVTGINGDNTQPYASGSIRNSTNVWMTNCIFDAMYNVGGMMNTNMQITGNRLNDFGNNGITVGDGAGLLVHNNVLVECPYGIDIGTTSRVIVSNNRIYNPKATGGCINIEANPSESITISGNTIYIDIANKTGINFSVGASTNVVVSNNTIVYEGAGTGIGLSLGGLNEFTVTGNVIKNSTRGIFVATCESGIIADNELYDCGDGYSPIHLAGADFYIVVQGNVIDTTTANGNAIREEGTSDYNYIIDNYVRNISWPAAIDNTGAHTVVRGNEGFIQPGEVRTVSGPLVAGNANSIGFAWNNPHGTWSDIYILKVVVVVITGGGTVGSHLDVGIADDAAGTNRGTEFFDDLLLNNVQVNDSWVGGDGGTQTKWVYCENQVSATDAWVVGQILDAHAASLVGFYYIEYVGEGSLP